MRYALDCIFPGHEGRARHLAAVPRHLPLRQFRMDKPKDTLKDQVSGFHGTQFNAHAEERSRLRELNPSPEYTVSASNDP